MGVLRETETVERDQTRSRQFWASLTYGWRVSWALTCPVAPKGTVTFKDCQQGHRQNEMDTNTRGQCEASD